MSRRMVAKGAAWSTPVLALSAPAPAAATSVPSLCAHVGASVVLGEPQLVGGSWSTAPFGGLYQLGNDLKNIELPFTVTLANPLPGNQLYFTILVQQSVAVANSPYLRERFNASGVTAPTSLSLNAEFTANEIIGPAEYFRIWIRANGPLAAGTHTGSVYLHPDAELTAADFEGSIPGYQVLPWDEAWAPWLTDPATDG